MDRTFTNRQYLDALQSKVMVFDGAMGTNLQAQNLTADHFGGEKTKLQRLPGHHLPPGG